MEFSEYQQIAARTDQKPATGNPMEDRVAMMIPMLGLSGEVGTLLTHYKRFIRDGEKYSVSTQRMEEELGDILWNVANIASKAGLSLESIATRNVRKITDRWYADTDTKSGLKLFDEGFPPAEQFPRKFKIDVQPIRLASGSSGVQLSYCGSDFGNPLSDNSREDDGYRLHDVFHLTFLALLGWSPVLRHKRFFDCKRRSRPDIDEIEDGGRAAVIEEAIAALIFVESKKNSMFDGIDTVEYGLLRNIRELTAHLEVAVVSSKQWEATILTSFRVWRALRAHGRGAIRVDLNARSISFEPLGAT